MRICNAQRRHTESPVKPCVCSVVVAMRQKVASALAETFPRLTKLQSALAETFPQPRNILSALAETFPQPLNILSALADA
jgi:hypothetical protein